MSSDIDEIESILDGEYLEQKAMIAEIISKKSEDELFSSASVKLQALSIEDLLDLFSCLKISCQSKLPATVWMKFYEKLADQYFSDYWSGKLNIESQILSLISMEFVRKILNEGYLQNSELLPEISEEEKTSRVHWWILYSQSCKSII
ncbi:Uncharacterised protein g9649 [Pycnogonum litorale]